MGDAPEKLDRVVEELLRGQPLRRAPASLEARVIARLGSRGLPVSWWRRGFTHWPLAARVAFLIASYGFIRLALAGVMSVITFVRSEGIAQAAISWVHVGAVAVSATVSLGDFLLHAIPPLWLYGAAGIGFLLYAALFGLRTVAYRTLYVDK